MTMDESALDSIDDLLAKGDTNAALLVINMVTNGLNGDSSPVHTVEMRDYIGNSHRSRRSHWISMGMGIARLVYCE